MDFYPCVDDVSSGKWPPLKEEINLSQQLHTMITESYTQHCFEQLQLEKEESEPGYLPLCSVFPALVGT